MWDLLFVEFQQYKQNVPKNVKIMSRVQLSVYFYLLN